MMWESVVKMPEEEENEDISSSTLIVRSAEPKKLMLNRA